MHSRSIESVKPGSYFRLGGAQYQKPWCHQYDPQKIVVKNVRTGGNEYINRGTRVH